MTTNHHPATRAPTSASAAEEVVVSIVIVNYFIADKVRAAVTSIAEHCTVSYEIIVVDNSASDDEYGRLKAWIGARCRLLSLGYNAGFGTACNAGARVSVGKYLFFLNPDARMVDGSLERLVAALESDPRLGAVGGVLVDERGFESHSGGRQVGLRTPLGDVKALVLDAVRTALRRGEREAPPPRVTGSALRRLGYVIGADLLMRKQDFEKIGGFDESFFMYVEDAEIQYRLTKELGLYAAIDPGARFFHELGGTPNVTKNWRRCLVTAGRLRFVHKHRGPLYRSAYRLLTVQWALGHVSLGRLTSRYSLAEDWALLRTALSPVTSRRDQARASSTS